MKIGVENLGFKGSHLERDKKINRASENSSKDNNSTEIKIENTSFEIKDAYLQIQRDISVSQTKLNSFLLVQERILDNKQYTEQENSDFLKELTTNTRLKEEQILIQYEKELAGILANSDIEKLDELIRATETEITEYSSRIDSIDQTKNTAEQNLLAIKNNISKKDLENLMQDVVSKLKESEIPGINIAREKIIDLL